MRDILKTLARPTGDTLAAWVMALGPDSPCFCCGYSLRVHWADKSPVRPDSRLLRCRRCGTEVSGEGACEVADDYAEVKRYEQAAA